MSISLGYIVFWSVLFTGLVIWLRNVKTKFAKIAPTLLTSFIVLFTITGAVFATNYFRDNESSTVSRDPIPNEPIGTGVGLNPGRVVWVWNPNATEKYLQGYWWEEANNNQSVIDQMVSDGIKNLSGENNSAIAWDALFKYFNEVHGNGDVGYQPGEKIAIKINLNNQYVLFGDGDRTSDDDRDASPYVIKALLKQLVNEVGVAQDDITVFDSSRTIGDWFYYRVYYESYPALPLVPEFPNVHYIDAKGNAIGREKVVPSSEKVYFADSTGLTRTLPQNVVDAKYIINMPILKKHPVGNGFTASGKNFFGIFIEPVVDGLHQYYAASLTGGNAPQVDLFAAEEVGGKTLLYLGDGTFATKEDHANIAKFNMYPFNGDWTNSLFFSQDPVTIDSVMYDFLYAEGTNPSEASQNYLHIAAAPPPDVYDPEHDGVYLSESLGVHEHWNTTVDIFSPDRYIGIDYVAVSEEYATSGVFITKPILNHLYINGEKIKVSRFTSIIGKIDVEAQANILYGSIKKMQFYLDGRLEFTDDQAPFVWSWNKPVLIPFKHIIKVVASYDNSTVYDTITVRKIL
ncbi:Uncharacterised protein [uncultured archaeon]|nr:Uncharacterised protein [uncultured archaeon]